MCRPLPRRAKKGKKKKRAKNYGRPQCTRLTLAEQFITSEDPNATIESSKEKHHREAEMEENNHSFGNEEGEAILSTDGKSGEKRSPTDNKHTPRKKTPRVSRSLPLKQ